MSIEELQKYWDACLIRCWRRDLYLSHAVKLFKLYSGKFPWEVDLLRIPPDRHYWKKPTRGFVARFMPKLSDWLFDHPQEQDLELLNKITATKYTAVDTGVRRDKETRAAKYRMEKDIQRINVVVNLLHNGNREWNVTKTVNKRDRRRS